MHIVNIALTKSGVSTNMKECSAKLQSFLESKVGGRERKANAIDWTLKETINYWMTKLVKVIVIKVKRWA